MQLKGKSNTLTPTSAAADDNTSSPRSGEEHSYDLIVYGATGVVGQIVARYLYIHYKNHVKVILSGRSERKLQELQTQYPFDIVECNSAEYEECTQLAALLAPTGCMINLAGPYLTSGGANIVKACVEAKVGICDISGEIPFCRDNIIQHHTQAVEHGVRIVKFSGHDSLFFSMVINQLAEKLRRNREELVKVELFDYIVSQPSLGTIKTTFQLNKIKQPRPTGTDPLLLGGDPEYSLKNRNITKLTTSKYPGICTYLLPFFMAGVNFSCAKRDNAILKYGKNVEYIEGQAKMSMWLVFTHYVAMIYTYVLILTGFYRNPTTTEMQEMYLDVVGVATGDKGTVVKGMFSVDGDPGYLHTATACVETALCMILNRDRLNDHCGVISPAILNNGTNVLMDRLIACPAKCFTFQIKEFTERFSAVRGASKNPYIQHVADFTDYQHNYKED